MHGPERADNQHPQRFGITPTLASERTLSQTSYGVAGSLLGAVALTAAARRLWKP